MTVRPQCRSDDTVAERIGELLDQATGLVERPGPLLSEAGRADPRDTLSMITAAVLASIENAADEEAAATLLEFGTHIQDFAAELQERADASQRDLRAQVHQGLNRLRELSSSAELIDRVCDEVIRSCGFSRVLLSRVEQQTWRPWQFRTTAGPEFEATFRALISDLEMPIAGTPVEAEILTGRRPAIVRKARPDATPMNHLLQSTSYVVAPITPAGRVLGLLHADHEGGSAVDEIDRDLLWIFAEGFGRIYERTELLERLRAQRSSATSTLRAIDTITAAVDDAAIELTTEPQRQMHTTRAGSVLPATSRALIEELTTREREVLALMLRGHGNAAIATELFISHGTAKTHVSRILRKLGAPNRAAVAGLVLGEH